MSMPTPTNLSTSKQEKIKDLIQTKNLVVFTCTYYPTTNDLRLQQCIQTLNEPTYGSSTIATVVVDGSPPDVHEYLIQQLCVNDNDNDNKQGLTGLTVVVKEEGRFGRGKGGALREAADVAASLDGVGDDTWLCWQEAEKSDMMRCWQTEVIVSNVQNCSGSGSNVNTGIDADIDAETGIDTGIDILSEYDVICPKRGDGCFKQSYPIEQYHSESYGNYYMNCVMKGALQVANDEMGPVSGIACKDIDWHFGPFAFRRKLLPLWLKYEGTSYDAQLIPIVAAIRKGYSVNSSLEVTFLLDGKMKEQEEGNLEFIEKRLLQLNDLDPKLKQSWEDDLYC